MTGGSVPIGLRGLTKRYGNTHALRGVDLDLVPGEVLGVAGPNGAGKSTLMKLLAGEESADGGTIVVGGRPCSAADIAGRVAVVHQEPQLFPNMTLAENMMVGREGTRLLRPRLGPNENALMTALDLGAREHALVADCSLATQQRVEIARALARRANAFLFDEPNSALDAEESVALFAEIHRLADAGNIVLLVTHRLEDLVRHADRVVVVRDGRIAAELSGDALTEEAVAHVMVQGLEPDFAHRARPAVGSPDTAARDGLAEMFGRHGLSVPPGRVVALIGVEGSGAREYLRSFASMGRDIAYVAPSRAESLFANLSVGDNAVARLGIPDIAGRTGNLSRPRMRGIVTDAIRRFRVKTLDGDQPIRTLSGGNQQKVAIAQALLKRPRLVLLEEPTRGVDIGSKREIYTLLRDVAEAGTRVMIFCTEILEAFEAADQVHVFHAGRLGPPIEPDGFDSIEAFASVVARETGELGKEKSLALPPRNKRA